MPVAKDGKVFGHPMQMRKYEQSLEENSQANRSRADVDNAPGGEEHEHNIKAHGMVMGSKIDIEGPGRFRLSVTHQDGHVSTSVHPQWFRAHDVQAKYFNPDGKPDALETHQRARAHPTGPKEEKRIAEEDGRETEDE